MTAFDILFWLLVIMLGVVAYAVEAGLAVRHRNAVLVTMFSIVAAILYMMLGGGDGLFSQTGEAPGKDAAAVVKKLPDGQVKTGGGIDLPDGLGRSPPAPKAEIDLPTAPFTDCPNCPSMIAIAPGNFSMGSPPTEPGRQDTEGPVDVSIKTPYAAGRYEVSRDQFAAFVEDAKYQSSSGCVVGGRQSLGANWQQPGFEQAGNHPVVCVAWRDAKAYVAWLSTKTNKKYRLLSESEWEYMARAKARTPFANGAALGSGNANFNRGRDGTIPIGYTTSNDFGFFDVHGNVWELVDDCWYPDLGFNSNDGRATLLRGDCSERVIKGGGWDSTALQSRLAARGRVAVGSAANTVGFRVARAMD